MILDAFLASFQLHCIQYNYLIGSTVDLAISCNTCMTEEEIEISIVFDR